MEEYQHDLFVECEEQEDRTDTKQILYKYFSVRGKSGGGDCIVFQMTSRLYRISFRSEQVRDQVLQHDRRVVQARDKDFHISLHLSRPQEAPDVTSELAAAEVNIPEKLEIPNCEKKSKVEVKIPCKEAYHDLLRPYFLTEIENHNPDLQFDLYDSTLKIEGPFESVSAAKDKVNETLHRLRTKKVSISPLLIAFLQSQEPGEVIKTFFKPLSIYATLDLSSSENVVVYGLSLYDVERAEKILEEKMGLKEVHLDAEMWSLANKKKFSDFIEQLNRSHSAVQICLKTTMEGNEEKNTYTLAGLKMSFAAVEKKIHEFLQEECEVKSYINLNGSLEVKKNLHFLLDYLDLSHLAGKVQWNPELQVIELTGTPKSNEEAKVVIEERTKDLLNKTITICRPGAFSYFRTDGKEYLGSLKKMLSCQAILHPEPGDIQASAFVSASTSTQHQTTNDISFEILADDKNRLIYIKNVSICIVVADKVTDMCDIIINPLCRSTTGSKMLNAAGLSVKAELARLIQRNAITVTGPGHLPCRLLVHVPCLCGQRAPEFIKEVIQESRKRKFKSITIFIDENELHGNVHQDKLALRLILTLLTQMKAGECFRIVVAQETLSECFEKQAIASIQDQINTKLNCKCCLPSTLKSLYDPESLHYHSSLCEPAIIHLFSKESDMLSKAEAAIENHYAGFLSTDNMVDPHLHHASEPVKAKIRELQDKHGVNVIVEDEIVAFNGLSIRTILARKEAHKILIEACDHEHFEQKKQVSLDVQWVITTEENDKVKLNCVDNYKVEVQHMCLMEPITVKIKGQDFIIDLKNLTATSKATSRVYRIQRGEPLD